MLSGSPIRHANCPYGLVRPCRQCGRIKFVPIKVNTARKDETTYHGRASAAQPPVIDSKRAYRVIGLRRQHGRMKIETVKLKIKCLNDERGNNGERTYLGCTGTTQPPVNDPDRQYGVHRTRRQHGRIKIASINISQMEEVKMTYHGRTQVAQPRGNAPEHCHRVRRPKRRCGRIKFEPKNVSRTQNGRNTYLGCVHAIWATWRPKKSIKRLDKLTFESRIPGEAWRDVEDHG